MHQHTVKDLLIARLSSIKYDWEKTNFDEILQEIQRIESHREETVDSIIAHGGESIGANDNFILSQQVFKQVQSELGIENDNQQINLGST